MSIAFSDTSTKKGIIQEIESECGFNDADISGNSTLLKKFTASINLALDDYISLAIRSSGTWQFDDSNQTDYPIITTNLVANQRDYAFTTDGSSNLILDIYKVEILNGSNYTEIYPVDQQSRNNNETNLSSFGTSTTGTPTRYDKTANAIFLDPIPSSNVTSGLRAYINREGSYFTYTDTTKKAGIPGNHQRYLVLKGSETYIRVKGTTDSYNKLQNEILKMENLIEEDFSSRQRDVKKRLSANIENTR